MADLAKRPNVAPSLIRVEADHVDGGVEPFPLHRSLKRFFVRAITDDQSRAVRKSGGHAAVEADDVVPEFEEQANDARADVSRAANDADFHGTVSKQTFVPQLDFDTMPNVVVLMVPCDLDCLWYKMGKFFWISRFIQYQPGDYRPSDIEIRILIDAG
tara:strand:+ start:3739 stop:4212 length:474 start_codon:yes stop_codon:yes gene_type:complete